jgi:hypothetical protein
MGYSPQSQFKKYVGESYHESGEKNSEQGFKDSIQFWVDGISSPKILQNVLIDLNKIRPMIEANFNDTEAYIKLKSNLKRGGVGEEWLTLENIDMILDAIGKKRQGISQRAAKQRIDEVESHFGQKAA